jgi:GntR family transcriptional repressor for pyruvate dehydrogenase complex
MNEAPSETLAADVVIEHVRRLVLGGQLTRGARLRSERELGEQLGVSRTSVRAGLQSLVAKGVLTRRRGAGTFVGAGPPALDTEALRLLAAVYGVPRETVFEARRILEVRVAGMAASRATSADLAAISDAVTGMFAAVDDPQAFLVCDIRFHRTIAAASGNSILACLVEMVSALFYERRRHTAERQRDLRPIAEIHYGIYRSIRDRDPLLAERLMNDHLRAAERSQQAEGPDLPFPAAVAG